MIYIQKNYHMPRKVYSFSQFLGENYYIKEDKMNFGKIGGMMKKAVSTMIDWASNLKKAIRDKVFGVITSGPKSGTSPVKIFLPEDGNIVSQIKKAYAGTKFGSMNTISPQELQKISESSGYDFENQYLYEGEPAKLTSDASEDTKGIMNVGTSKLYELLENEFKDTLDGDPLRKVFFIFGAPGIGKTMIVGQIAQKYRVPLVDLDVSLRNIEDLAGVPSKEDVSKETLARNIEDLEKEIEDMESRNPNDPKIASARGRLNQFKEVGAGVTRDNPPFFLPRESGKGGIIFLDEANRPANRSVLNVIAQFVQDKRIGTYKLPAKWMLVAAGNRPGEGDVENLDSSFWRRILPVNFVPDPEIWRSYSTEKGFPGAIVDLIVKDPELFHNLQMGDKTQPSYASPASWEVFFHDISKTIRRKRLRDWTDISNEDLEELLVLHVGRDAAEKMMNYLKNFKLLTREEIETIFSKPEEAKMINLNTNQIGDQPDAILLGFSSYLAKILADEHSTKKEKDGKTYYEIDDLQKVGNLFDYLTRYKKSELSGAIYSDLGKMWPMFSWNNNYLLDEPYEVYLDEFKDGTRDENDPLVQAALLAEKYRDKALDSSKAHKAGEAL